MNPQLENIKNITRALEGLEADLARSMSTLAACGMAIFFLSLAILPECRWFCRMGPAVWRRLHPILYLLRIVDEPNRVDTRGDPGCRWLIGLRRWEQMRPTGSMERMPPPGNRRSDP